MQPRSQTLLRAKRVALGLALMSQNCSCESDGIDIETEATSAAELQAQLSSSQHVAELRAASYLLNFTPSKLLLNQFNN